MSIGVIPRSFRGVHILLVWTWFLTLSLGVLGAEVHWVRLRNESFSTPDPGVHTLRPQGVLPPVSGLFVLQLQHAPTADDRSALQQLGVELLRYVPDNAYVARLRQARLDQIRLHPSVRWVGSYRPDHKVLRSLLHDSTQTALQGRPQEVRILLAPDLQAAERLRILKSIQTLHSEAPFQSGTILHATVPLAQVQQLAESESILWIESVGRPRLLDEVATKIVGGGTVGETAASHLAKVHALGFEGQGVIVAVADSGLYNGDNGTMHPDLVDRVDGFFHYGALEDAADEHSHGTHVTGIIAGDGATGETDENGALYGLGVAPKAHIVAQRVFDADGKDYLPSPDVLTRDAVRSGAVIGSNSWGDDSYGRYDLFAAQFDALVRDADPVTPGDQPYILEFSAGNSGPGAQTIGTPAVAKNVIATGASQNDRPDFFLYADGIDAMADFSSRGPCEDGRIKPDIVAPGTWIASLQSASATDENAWLPISPNYQYQGGTSQAGPHVSGAAAVFVQYYRSGHNGATPSPALVKAALIDCAVDMDDSVETGPIPNNDEGWGRVDLTRIIGSSRRVHYIDQSVALTNSQVHEERVVVSSDVEPLRITLTYTDVPGLPAALPALVNDLDLEVISPDGHSFHGNQMQDGFSVPDPFGWDNLNNVEGVRIEQPVPGEYTIRVIARRVVEDAVRGTPFIDQDFALAVSGLLPSPGEGVVFFDHDAYSPPSTAMIRLIDPDLAGLPSVTVNVSSTSFPGGSNAVLTAQEPGVFRSSIALVPSTASPGTPGLRVKHGDLLTVTYTDAAPAGLRTAQAVIDQNPPVISGVKTNSRLGQLVLSWTTDEPSTSIVLYGTKPPLTTGVTNRFLETSHSVILSNLPPGAVQLVRILSADSAGNLTVDDNHGSYYPVTPVSAPPVLLVDAYEPDPEGGSPEIPRDTYTSPLDQLGVGYEVWDVSLEGRTPGAAEMKPFQVVMWRISDSAFSSTSIAPADQTAIQQYLSSGGAFFMSSMEILTRLGDTPFRTNVLQVSRFDEDVGVPSIEGSDRDPITAGMSMDLNYDAYNNDILDLLGQSPDFADTLTLSTNAAPILFDLDTGRAVGARYPKTGQDAKGRVVFLSFPIDAVPESGEIPNNRSFLLRNILGFLVPGLNGFTTLALDSGAYTLPSRATVELADATLAGKGPQKLLVAAGTNTAELVAAETTRPGLFRASFFLIPADSRTNASVVQIPARNGDPIKATFLPAAAKLPINATAVVDTLRPVISRVVATPDYEEATLSWETDEFTDSLIQFGESSFLGRTAYDGDLGDLHEVQLVGLKSDRLYYYQVVSRDEAGNVTVDDNGGKLYTFRTLKPIIPPWMDSLETGGTNWTVFSGDDSESKWTLGLPRNGHLTAAHSPKNAWCSNIEGGSVGFVQTFLISPPIDLSGGNTATLRFWHAYDFSEHSALDVSQSGTVMIVTNNNLGSPITLAQYGDDAIDWEQEELDLSTYSGHVVNLVWYWEMISFDDEGVARPGWAIDDISVQVTNVVRGLVAITNNLAQASFSVAGPIVTSGTGSSLVLSNAPGGRYVVTWHDVPYYTTPPAQTNDLAGSVLLTFNGIYTFDDANHNGIPDGWEKVYFGSVSPTRNALTDTDGDGVPDAKEFLSGTNPTNATSFLRILPPQLQSNRTVHVAWPSATGFEYRILGSTNATSWAPFTEWIRATNAQSTASFPPLSISVPYFFKLEARP